MRADCPPRFWFNCGFESKSGVKYVYFYGLLLFPPPPPLTHTLSSYTSAKTSTEFGNQPLEARVWELRKSPPFRGFIVCTCKVTMQIFTCKVTSQANSGVRQMVKKSCFSLVALNSNKNNTCLIELAPNL